MNIDRRRTLAALALAATPLVRAQGTGFPSKPIRIIVPFAAGGLARAVAQVLPQHLPGATVLVENRAGASGTIGIAALVAAPPDGHTLAFAPMGPIAIQPHLGARYSLEDIQPVMRMTTVPLVLAVRADAPWKTLDDWLADVRARPGSFTYATPGAGTNAHIAMEALALALRSPMTHVPYQGNPQSINAVLGGHVQGTLLTAPDLVPFVQAGTLRLLANAGLTRYEAKGFEQLPFLRERGVGVAFDTMYGFLAPRGLPRELLATLDGALKKTLEDPAVADPVRKFNMPVAYAGPAEFAELVRKESAANGEVLKQVKIQK
jgi:tripartite-type tricarboxylate transporter receptor subunit TctC